MFVLEALLSIAVLISLVVVVISSWVLHLRLRNRHSLGFAVSVTALASSLPLLPVATRLVLMYSDHSKPSQLANWLVICFEILLPATLVLLAATTFCLVVRTVGLPVHDSSKPAPHS